MGKASRAKKFRAPAPETGAPPKVSPPGNVILRPLPGLILCVFLALVFNFDVLQNEFGWDDEKIINGLGASFSVSDFFFPASRSGAKSYAPYYRPLVSLSYRIDHAIWGKNPFGYHLSVLLFHLLNTALVFLLARSLVSFSPPLSTPYSPLPLLSASLFAVHPIHSEAVAWIAGRNDVFCTTFVLASFISYLRFSRSGTFPAFALSMLFFALALLTKEMAVGLFFVFPFFWALSRQTGKGFSFKILFHSPPVHLMIPLVIVAAYFSLRSQGLALPYGGSSSPSPFETISPAKLIPVFGHYVKGLLFPFPHQPYLSEIPSSSLSIVFTFLVLALCFLAFVRAFRKTNLIVGTGVLWFVFLLAPALAVPLLGLGATTPLADRYLYAPSVGFFFILSWILVRTTGLLRQKDQRGGGVHQGILLSVFLGLIILLGIESQKRASVWRTPLSFWSASVKNLKAGPVPAAIAYDNLGTAYQNKGEWDKAEKAYLEAVQINPDFSQAHSNLGVLYKFRGRENPEYFEKGLQETYEALRLAPGSFEARNNLGDIYTLQGKFEDALREYQEALKIKPRDPKIHNNRGIIFRHQGRYRDSIREHRMALEFDPGMAEARINLGSVYLEMGENKQAIIEYKKGLVMDPSNIIATFGMGIAFERTGDINRAKEALSLTLMIDPGHVLAREALARLGN